MKKYLILALFIPPLLLWQPLSLSFEGKPGEFKLPEKPSKEYKDPKTEKEAVEEWDKAQKGEEEAQAAREEVKQKSDDARTRANKAGKVGDEKGKAKALQEEAQWNDRSGKINAVLKEWKERKEQLMENDLVSTYANHLSNIYEKPISPTIEEPGWWKKLRKGVEAWIKGRQIDYYSWTGNKEKLAQAQSDVASIYADLGKGGLLDKARANKEFSKVLDELDKKIGKSLTALKDYARAKEEGTITKKNEEQIKSEIKELIIDLSVLKEELAEGVTANKVRIDLETKINKALEDFKITGQEEEDLQKEISQRFARIEAKGDPQSWDIEDMNNFNALTNVEKMGTVIKDSPSKRYYDVRNLAEQMFIEAKARYEKVMGPDVKSVVDNIDIGIKRSKSPVTESALVDSAYDYAISSFYKNAIGTNNRLAAIKEPSNIQKEGALDEDFGVLNVQYEKVMKVIKEYDRQQGTKTIFPDKITVKELEAFAKKSVVSLSGTDVPPG